MKIGLSVPKSFNFRDFFNFILYYTKYSTHFSKLWDHPTTGRFITPRPDENSLPGHMSFEWLLVLPQGEQQAFQLFFRESKAKCPESLPNEALSSQLVG